MLFKKNENNTIYLKIHFSDVKNHFNENDCVAINFTLTQQK